MPFKAIWLNTTNQSVGNVWSPETPNNHFPTYSNSNDINNYNYIPSTWSADNGAYLRLKEIVLGYTLPKAWMNKSGFISNLRIYVSGADLWENRISPMVGIPKPPAKWKTSNAIRLTAP